MAQEDLRGVFEALPLPCVLLDVDLVITQVSGAYTATMGMAREQLVGRYLFDAFPLPVGTDPAGGDVGGAGAADAVDGGVDPLVLVRASMLRVLATGQPDPVPLQKYDIPDPASPTGFAERWWSSTTFPVTRTVPAGGTAAGQPRVTGLLHVTEDVTKEITRRSGVPAADLDAVAEEVQRSTALLCGRTQQLEADLYARAVQVQTLTAAREVAAARLAGLARTALALADAGSVADLETRITDYGLAATGCDSGAVAIFAPGDPTAMDLTITDGFGAAAQQDHLQVVVRYRAAARSAQVGGDWYDAFLQPDGATVLVIGDVIGHDPIAAAAMGQVRAMLRAVAAHTGDGPAQVLGATDRLLRTLVLETTATALVARLEQGEDERARGVGPVRWSSAGHLPPLVIDASGSVTALGALEPDLMLGVDPATRRHESVVTVEHGATLLLHTDGLVERRGESLEEGLARLREGAAELAGAGVDLDALIDGLLDRLVVERGEEADDDVAVIAVRLHRQDRPRPAVAGAHRVPQEAPPEPVTTWGGVLVAQHERGAPRPAGPEPATGAGRGSAEGPLSVGGATIRR